MKKFLIALLILSNLNSTAQINYQHTFPGPNSNVIAEPTIINLGNNEYKYFYVDYASNELKLFNMDFSSYASVTIPVVMVNPFTYNIGYVTKSLFDCDTNKFEYAVFPADPRQKFYVYREDGTLIFQRDSSLSPYCIGCYNASYDVRPIVNTPSGAVLFLGRGDAAGGVPTVDVFSLCGTLPDAIIESHEQQQLFMKVFPNPASGEINFEFDLPSNYHQYELTIFNSSLQAVRTLKISGITKKYKLDGSSLSSGVYFFRLQNENKILQTAKLILTK